MDKFFPQGWSLAKTAVWALTAAVVLNFGSDLYLKFAAPVVRGMLNP